MTIPRAYFSMLYIDALQSIVAGPGGQEMAISSQSIEIYHMMKNKWTVIDTKTNWNYFSVSSTTTDSVINNNQQSFLWHDIDNPFIVNLCNGKDYAEFLDLREQRQWIVNHKLNTYFKQWSDENHNGQLLI